MPNNTITLNGNYESIAMDTNAKQLYMLAPVFLVESVISVLKQFNIPSRTIAQKALRLVLPLSEEEARNVELQYPKLSKGLAIVNNVCLGINIATGAFMLYRAQRIENNLGDNEVGTSDINYSWLTSWTGMVPSLAFMGLNVAKKILLHNIPANKIIPTFPVEINDPKTLEKLLNCENINLKLTYDESSKILKQISNNA